MQIYDDSKKKIGTLTNFKDRKIVKTLDSGDKELTFKYPANGKQVGLLKVEHYIRTKEDEYVLRAVKTGSEFNEYTAQLNVEELETQAFPYGFESQEQDIRSCLEFAFEGTGWTVGECAITKKRTINFDKPATAWDVLQQCLSTYRVECKIDTINKRIDIYEQIGNDKGCYFVEGLNLRKLTVNSDTYDFYTRLIPLGKDGINIEWLTGKLYLENYQYSSKVKTIVWKDERYTNTTSLIEDGTAKLEEMSKPYRVFSADVVDLARQNKKYKNILDFDIGDTVLMISRRTKSREKQREDHNVSRDTAEEHGGTVEHNEDIRGSAAGRIRTVADGSRGHCDKQRKENPAGRLLYEGGSGKPHHSVGGCCQSRGIEDI